VKRVVAGLLLVSGLLVVAGGANATPVTWTIPPTTLSGSGSGIYSISGTFVYDADTNTTSSINLSSTISGTTTALTYAGLNSPDFSIDFLRFQASAVANVGTLGAFLPSTGLTNTGGSVTIAVFLGNGLCAGVTSGLCDNFIPGGLITSPVTVTGIPAPSAVPTLSEWAQLMLGLMVITMLGWQWRKQQM